MANMTLDFSSVPSREVLPEGVYTALIKKVEEKKSSTGKDMIVVLYEETEKKTGVFENYVMDPSCMWKLKELLDALGFDTSGTVDFNPADLEGQFVKVKLIQDEYNGETVNRVKKVYAA